jgi:hypothetical protein
LQVFDKQDRLHTIAFGKGTHMELFGHHIERAIVRLPVSNVLDRDQDFLIRPPPNIPQRVPPQEMAFIFQQHNELPRFDLLAARLEHGLSFCPPRQDFGRIMLGVGMFRFLPTDVGFV